MLSADEYAQDSYEEEDAEILTGDEEEEAYDDDMDEEEYLRRAEAARKARMEAKAMESAIKDATSTLPSKTRKPSKPRPKLDISTYVIIISSFNDSTD